MNGFFVACRLPRPPARGLTQHEFLLHPVISCAGGGGIRAASSRRGIEEWKASFDGVRTTFGPHVSGFSSAHGLAHI